jgi:hypothetical protein
MVLYLGIYEFLVYLWLIGHICTFKCQLLSLPSEDASLDFFLMVLGLELRTYTLSHSTSPFFVMVFLR